MTHIHSSHKTVELSLTTAVATTEALDFREYSHGTISNESGGALALTYYTKIGPGGTVLALEDQDNVAVTQSLGDDEICALPDACAGCSYVCIVADSAATVNVFCKR